MGYLANATSASSQSLLILPSGVPRFQGARFTGESLISGGVGPFRATQLTNGWILVAGNNTNKVYKSTDNGATWDAGTLVASTSGLRGINQLANGRVLTTGSTTSKIYSSIDNGASWDNAWSNLFADDAPIPSDTLQGYLTEGSGTNLALQSEVFSNAAWVATTLTVADNSTTGPDGVTTTADTLTASALNAMLLQTVVSGSATRDFSIWLKRKTGTGTINLTVDGGVTWTPKTITSAWARYDITQAAVTNPVFGVQIATSGDAIYAWGAQLESAAFASSYIATTTASVTRAADALSYPTTNNVFNTAGSATAEITAESWGNVAGQYLGDGTTAPLLASSANSGVQAYDGTNTVNGPTGTPASLVKVGSSWKAATLKAFANGNLGASGAYDGAFALSTLAIGSSYFGTIKNVKIWKKALKDSILNKLTT